MESQEREARIQRAEQIRALKGEERIKRMEEIMPKVLEYERKRKELAQRLLEITDIEMLGSKGFLDQNQKWNEEWDSLNKEFESVLGEYDILKNESE